MQSKQVSIYEPSNSSKRGFAIIGEMFNDLKNSTGLAYRLFLRDKKAEYRQSLLGVFWAFITPLTNALVWIFLSASGAINVNSGDIPYPLFVFLGTLLWSIFSESLTMPLNQTNAAKGLISKINFPKEAVLLSGIYITLFNTVIKIIIVILALLIFQCNPGINFIFFLLIISFTIIFGVSLGLVIAPLGLLYKDVGRVIPMALSFLMYLSPVVYKESKIKSLQNLLELNPLTPVINSGRNLATGGWFENIPYLLLILGITIIIGFFGWLFYRISIPIIVERM